jgi:type I restriction enzyme S subunit
VSTSLSNAAFEERRLKFLADVRPSNVDKKSVEDQQPVRLCNYTDVYYNASIDGDIDFMSATATPAQIERFGLRRGDVLLTKDSESPDDIGIPSHVTDDLPSVLCGYHLALIRPHHGVHGGFLAWCLRSKSAVAQLEIQASGVTRFGLSNRALSDLVLPAPPPATQLAIAAFLDHETERIDALVAKKQRLIDLLQEKRTALISHAVTKGLDPDVPMTDSGIEWLGELPASWTVSPLMRLVTSLRPIMYGIVLPGPDFPGGIPIVKGGDVSPERMVLESLKRTDPEIEARYVRSRLAGGDLVYAIRGSIGATAVVPDALEGANLTQDTARVAPRPGVDSGWLMHALQSSPVFAQLEARAVGATIRGINIFDLKRAVLPMPPQDEQVAIRQYLDLLTRRLDGLQESILEAIERLREYRSALITAAVTGQIDVGER